MYKTFIGLVANHCINAPLDLVSRATELFRIVEFGYMYDLERQPQESMQQMSLALGEQLIHSRTHTSRIRIIIHFLCASAKNMNVSYIRNGRLT